MIFDLKAQMKAGYRVFTFSFVPKEVKARQRWRHLARASSRLERQVPRLQSKHEDNLKCKVDLDQHLKN